MTTQDPLSRLLDSYPDWEGSRLLDLLIQSPNAPIHASHLEKCLTLSLTPQEAEQLHQDFAPIPMTDYQTLNAIDKRLNRLTRLKAESDSPAWDQEIAALTSYRRACTTPFGTIRSFTDADDKAYHRQFAAIRRLLNRASAEGHHEAVAIIKQHLRKGRLMMWEENRNL